MTAPPDLPEPLDAELLDTIADLARVGRFLHRHEVRGMGLIPREGPLLLAVNHSLVTYDIGLLQLAIFEATGRVCRNLADRAFWRFGLGGLVEKGGAVVGNHKNADRLLRDGNILCVAPGGMHEALRGRKQRYELRWDSRRGFVKLALRNQVPVMLAACPAADRVVTVYDNPLTRLVYDKLRAPLPLFRGAGPTLLPRPIKLVHYLSGPHPPPEHPAGEEPPRDMVDDFHTLLTEEMERLMSTEREEEDE